MSAPRYLWRQLDQKQRAGVASLAQDARLSVAFAAAPAELWTSAFYHLGILFRASSLHRPQPGAHGQFFARSAGCVRDARGPDVCVVHIAES
ncbi:MAG TPA: hypothetical protein VK562_05585, partial [Candidatus Acidoferrum sp.]|nr:hypothetical protein [Candidatus Acidoferrum sp.]